MVHLQGHISQDVPQVPVVEVLGFDNLTSLRGPVPAFDLVLPAVLLEPVRIGTPSDEVERIRFDSGFEGRFGFLHHSLLS